MKKRIVFAISGASGMPLALAMLEDFAAIPELEIHLIVSENAQRVLVQESPGMLQDFTNLAGFLHDCKDLSAPPASGSWPSFGMLVCPCSMASLGAIANGFGTNLIHRAADVALKERRPLILVIRETPLGRIHLKNMLLAADAGAVIMPFIPAFYTRDISVPGLFRQFAGRVMDQLGVSHDLCERWREEAKDQT